MINRRKAKSTQWYRAVLHSLATAGQAWTKGGADPAADFRRWLSPGWWTLLFALGVALAFGYGGLYSVPVAHAADDTLTLCPAGQELDNGLCYPKCNDGYTGIGPVCWKQCPDGYHDDGALCRKDAVITAKDSYGRGAGTPMGCGAGEEQNGALCYPKCKDGYSGVGPVCWQQCPNGYHDDGAVCRKDAVITAKDSYGRGAGTPMGCGAGEEQNGALCYPTCRTGYTGVGPVCWQKCPTNYTDIGALCRYNGTTITKQSHAATQSCRAGYTNVLGICWQNCPSGYTDTGAFCEPSSFAKDSYVVFPAWDPCRAGYTNVAGVCWQNCPADYTDIGAFCRHNGSTFAKDSYPATQTCESGYTNVAGICWQNCPADYTDTGAFCEPKTVAKDSYGRGAGVPLHTCGDGQQADGGLCYPTCKDGYSGVGPVCWQNCPPGFTDDGATCRQDAIITAKDSYGRGAGVPLHTCGDGQQGDGGLCYPTCKDGYSGVGPVCWQNCPAGFTDDGATCRQDAIITAKDSYGRGAGTVPCDVNLGCASYFETDNHFRSFPNGYQFPNWGKSDAIHDDSTDFDNATLIRMFGKGVCKTGSTASDCVLTAAAQQWRTEQLKSWSGGHCYGMAATSQLFFAGFEKVSDYQGGAVSTWVLSDLTAAVRSHITEMASTQHLTPADGSGMGIIGLDKKPSEILNLIRTQLQDKAKDPYVLSFFYSGKGHAVTPYAIQNQGNGIYWLHIYDNNWPNEDRYIVFDVNQETWLYNFAATNPSAATDAWHGDAKTKSLRLRPTSALKLSGWVCSFCGNGVNASQLSRTDKVEFNLIGAGNLLVINPQHQAIGWDFNTHQLVNQVAGAEVVDYVVGPNQAASPLLRLPALQATTPYTLYATGDGLTQTVKSSLMMVGPGFTVGVNDLVLNPQQNLLMTIRPDGRQFTFQASASGIFTPTIYLANDNDAQGDSYLFNVGGVKLTAGKTVTVTLDLEKHQLNFQDNNTATDAYQMDLLRITATGQEQVYKADAVTLPTGADGTMNFGGWDGKGPINFTLDGETKPIDNSAQPNNPGNPSPSGKNSIYLPLVTK